MPRLMIILDVGADRLLEDPHEVAEEVLDDHDPDGNTMQWPEVRPFCGTPVKFVEAEWLE